MININTRDGNCKSPWQQIDEGLNVVDQLPQTADYDCLIIGAGITGLTAALLLQTEGKKTIIAEAHSVGFGTTGGTSAHINTFADATYKDVESDFGEAEAKLFAQAVQEGIDLIRENIKSYQIECDYEEKPGYIYSENDDQTKQLDGIYKSSLKADVRVVYSQNVPTRLHTNGHCCLTGKHNSIP
ncbi:MAG TPA: FAD-dependent oxidoreductase [Mucilaginibacter sp.]